MTTFVSFRRAMRLPPLVVVLALVLPGLSSRHAFALDGTRALTQYGRDSWSYQNGLPGGAVYDVVQLADGYIWLREASGLLRFDGVRFVPVTPVVAGEVLKENIVDIALTGSGRLLLRGRTRTLLYHEGVFSEATAPARLRDGTDRVVFQARDGAVWVGSDCNIGRLQDGEMISYAEGTGWVSAIAEDREGNIWLGGAVGLYRYRDGRFTLFPTGFNANMETANIPTERVYTGTRLRNSVTAVLEDREGFMWVGTHTGLFKHVDGRLVEDEQTEPLRGLHISSLLKDRQGNLWAGTGDTGLYRHAGGAWSRLTVTDGLSDNAVYSLCEDTDGSLWIGTRSGLDRLRDTPLITISAREGLSHDGAAAVTEGPDGSIFVYTSGGGITRMKDGTFSAITRRDGLLSDYAGTLYAARDGNVWIGTDHGLCTYRDGRITMYEGTKSLEGFYISSIHEDHESLLLGTTQLAMYRFKDGVLSPYNLALPPGKTQESVLYVFGMHRDEEDTMWFALTAGLYRVPKGMPPEKAERTAYTLPAHSVYDDRMGSIWVTGPDTRGVARLNKADGKLRIYGVEDGVPAADIGGVVTDVHGNLWLGTRNGIVNISRQELDDYTARRISKMQPRVYGMLDGMKVKESAGNDRQPSTWRARDGRLYFVTRKGVVVVDPARIPRNTRVPPVVIEEFLVDKLDIARGENVELAPGRESIEIHYTALSLLAPGRVRFKYQLIGYDKDWVDAGARRTAYYTHLPPGAYRFRVIAANEDGIWNETGASLAFTLRPRLYQAGWFYAACALGAVVAGHGLHRIRTRRLRQRQKVLEATVSERTGKLREEVEERRLAQQELQKHREYLEEVVAQRTQALRESNEQLQREIAERRASGEALRASEDRYRRFFEEDLAGSFIAKPSGELVACNPAFARIFAFSTGNDAVGLSVSTLFQHSDEAHRVLDRVRRDGKVSNCELEMKRRDARAVYVLANIIGTFDAEGRMTELKGFLVDTSDRMRLENQLRQAQKMEAIGQLAGGVAHDFNNLLTAIIGSSECLLADPGTGRDTVLLATEIRDAGLRAAGLTRQLLAFSRKQVLQPKIFSLNDVVSDMDKILRRLIGEDVRLELALSPELSRVRADPSQIEQIILNLTVNARDALPRGGRLSIETSNVCLAEPLVQGAQAVPAGSYVCLKVSDSGCGMSPEVQARAFEPFFTTKGPGRGSGLGLSTVYGIVQQSSGYMTLVSEVDRGTTFHVYLPVVEDTVDTRSAPPMALPGVTGRERILLVEDNELVLKVARRSLQQAGFKVFDATNGADALALCRAEQGAIDLLVTDVIMPGMNGRELAQEMTAEYPEIKVLYVSGYAGDALTRVGGVENVDMLEKPFTPEAIVRRVRAVLDAPRRS
jgi:PAS domain S-box-containing protein